MLLTLGSCNEQISNNDYNLQQANELTTTEESTSNSSANLENTEEDSSEDDSSNNIDLATALSIRPVTKKITLIQGDVSFLNIIGYFTLERVAVIPNNLEISFGDQEPLVQVIHSSQGYKIRAEKTGIQTLHIDYLSLSTEVEVEILDATVKHLLLDNSSITRTITRTGEKVNPDVFQIRAFAVLSDQQTIDVSHLVNWTFSNPTLLNQDTTSLSSFYTNSEGTGIVTASYHGFKAECFVKLQLGTSTLQQIFVENSPIILDIESTRTIKLLGLMSNGSVISYEEEFEMQLTDDEETDFSLDNDNLSILGEEVGNGKIKIVPLKDKTLAFETNVTIRDATLQNVVTEPSSIDLALGESEKIKILGVYSNGDQRDISSLITWTDADSEFITFDKAYPYEIQSKSIGSDSLTFSYQEITSQLPIQISEPTLESIQVSVDKSIVPFGQSATLTVMGTYSNSIVRDITDEVEYSLVGSSSSVATLQQVNGQNVNIIQATSTDTTAVSTAEVSIKKQGKEFGRASITISNAKVHELLITWKKPVPGGSTFTDVDLDSSNMETPWASLGEEICFKVGGYFENDLTTSVDISNDIEWRVDIDSDVNYKFVATFGTDAKHGCLISLGDDGNFGDIGIKAIYTDPVSGEKIVEKAAVNFEDKKLATPSIVVNNYATICKTSGSNPDSSCQFDRGSDIELYGILNFSNGSQTQTTANPDKSKIEDFEWIIESMTALSSNDSDTPDVLWTGDQVLDTATINGDGNLNLRFLTEGTYQVSLKVGSSHYIKDYDDSTVGDPTSRVVSTFSVQVQMPCSDGTYINDECYYFGADNESCVDICSVNSRELAQATCSVDSACEDFINSDVSFAAWQNDNTGGFLDAVSGGLSSTMKNGCFVSATSALGVETWWGYKFTGESITLPAQKSVGVRRVCSCMSSILHDDYKRDSEKTFKTANYDCGA